MLGDLAHDKNVVVSEGRDGGYGGWALIWVVFAIIIVFLFVVFAWKRDGHRDGIAELATPLALGMMGSKRDDHGEARHERWDTDRDVLREAGITKEKICESARSTDQQNAKYFFDQLNALKDGFKQVEVLGMQQTEKVLGAVAALTMTYKDDIIRKQDAELAAYKAAFMGHPVRLGGCDPAFPRG